MSPTDPLLRQVSLSQFPAWARNLAQALSAAGIAPRDMAATCATHLSAKCVVCDARVDGRELAALVLGEDLPAASPLKRLPQGYCVNEACKSSYYDFTCLPHPTLDWSRIEVSETLPLPAPPADTNWWAVALRAGWRRVADACTWRFAAGLAVLLVLWVWRQWWTGGSIPFFREEKTFFSQGAGNELPVMDDDDDK
jgi:hypothetical protein